MNNWSLLLLAVVVVIQPIGSFTESNLFNGRECCEHSTTREYGLDGTRKPNEQRRLSSLDGNLEERYERLTTERSSFERQISPKLGQVINENRFTRDHERRHRVATELRKSRGTVEDYNHNRDVLRSSLVQNERDSFESRNRESVDASRTAKLTRDVTNARITVERESRNRMSRTPTRTSRVNEDRRVSTNRQIETALKREREELARTDVRRDTRLTASDRPEKIENNRERRTFDRRTESNRLSGDRSISSFYEVRANAVNRLVSRRPATRMDARELLDEGRQQHQLWDSTQRMQGSKIVIGMDARESLKERRQQRDTQKTQESRPTPTRTDAGEFPADRRQKGEVRDSNERMQESRRSAVRMEARGSSVEQGQKREVRDNTERMQESRGFAVRIDARQSSEEGKQQREVRHTQRTQEPRRTVARMDARESSVERRQKREVREDTVGIQQSRRSPVRMDPRESIVERRQQREIRDNTERMQESRRSPIRMKARKSSVEKGQKREVRDNIERMQESSRFARIDARESSEGGKQQREVQDTQRTQESRRTAARMDARESSVERRQKREVRDNNERKQEPRRSVIRMDARGSSVEQGLKREIRDKTERMQESRRSPIRMEARGPSEEQGQKREVWDNTERMQESRRSPIRIEARGSSVEQGQKRELRENIERMQESRKFAVRARQSSAEGKRQREVRDTQTTQESRRTAGRMDPRESFVEERHQREVRDSTDGIQRLLRSPVRTDARESLEARRQQRKYRDSTERTQESRRSGVYVNANILEDRRQEHHRSGERLGERSQRVNNGLNRGAAISEHKREIKDNTGETRNAQNRDEIRMNKTLQSRRQKVTSSRASERLLSERIQDRQATRGSGKVGEVRMDGRQRRQRDFRESRTFRKSHDANELLTGKLPESTSESETRIERTTRNIERRVGDMNSRTDRQIPRKSDIRTSNDNLERMNRANPFKRDVRDVNARRVERNFKNIDAMTFRDTLDSEKAGESAFNNWQMVFYTLQVIYVSGLLVQMLSDTTNKTKKRTFSLWTSSNLIKVD